MTEKPVESVPRDRRQLNKLQVIRRSEEETERATLKQLEIDNLKRFMNVGDEPKIKVGGDHQAQIPALEVRSKSAQNRRNVVQLWDPDVKEDYN